jgi:hypothetical protein
MKREAATPDREHIVRHAGEAIYARLIFVGSDRSAVDDRFPGGQPCTP